MVTNSTPFINIPNYPDEGVLADTLKALPHHVTIDADTIAKDATGNVRASNFVMLGAASPFIEIPFEYLEDGIRAIFARKGEDVVEMNLKGLRAGREYALNFTQKA